VLEVLFELLVLLKEVLDLVFITLEDLAALIVERFLNVVQLVRVVCAHLVELEFHRGDQQIDVIVLLLQGVHIFVILGLELLHELADEVFLLANDSLAGILLLIDVL
jgi:hypothetical protein